MKKLKEIINSPSTLSEMLKLGFGAGIVLIPILIYMFEMNESFTYLLSALIGLTGAYFIGFRILDDKSTEKEKLKALEEVLKNKSNCLKS